MSNQASTKKRGRALISNEEQQDESHSNSSKKLKLNPELQESQKNQPSKHVPRQLTLYDSVIAKNSQQKKILNSSSSPKEKCNLQAPTKLELEEALSQLEELKIDDQKNETKDSQLNDESSSYYSSDSEYVLEEQELPEFNGNESMEIKNTILKSLSDPQQQLGQHPAQPCRRQFVTSNLNSQTKQKDYYSDLWLPQDSEGLQILEDCFSGINAIGKQRNYVCICPEAWFITQQNYKCMHCSSPQSHLKISNIIANYESFTNFAIQKGMTNSLKEVKIVSGLTVAHFKPFINWKVQHQLPIQFSYSKGGNKFFPTQSATSRPSSTLLQTNFDQIVDDVSSNNSGDLVSLPQPQIRKNLPQTNQTEQTAIYDLVNTFKFSVPSDKFRTTKFIPKRQFTVVTFNCRKIQSAPKQLRLINLLPELSYDILLLQETGLLNKIIFADHQMIQTDPFSSKGTLIAVKPQVRVLSQFIMSCFMASADIQVPTFYKEIRIINFYITPTYCTTEISRDLDIDPYLNTFLNFVKDSLEEQKMLIICGDFNQFGPNITEYLVSWGLQPLYEVNDLQQEPGYDQTYSNMKLAFSQRLHCKLSDHFIKSFCVLDDQ